MGIKLVDIDADTAAALGTVSADRTHLADLAGTSPVDRIGPGDVLSIQIYEVGAGLFAGDHLSLGEGVVDNSVPSASAKSVGTGIVVSEDGSITVPYVGRLAVAGLTTSQIQDKILHGLSGKSQSPQVLVNVQDNVTNTAVLMGAVTKPGRMPLTFAHDHLLDLIARAGGASVIATTGGSTATGAGPQDYVVRLTRGGRSVRQPLDEIESGTPDDVLVAPGDRIELVRQPRTFVVMGATDRISQIPFESRVLSLAEALGRVGGPSDARADPRSIFIFRDVPRLQPAGEDRRISAGLDGAATEIAKPTIYRLNMMHADSYFLAQRFAVQDKDVIYIANASSNQPAKLAAIVGALFAPVTSVFAVRAATR